jgi:hypothetical protein
VLCASFTPNDSRIGQDPLHDPTGTDEADARWFHVNVLKRERTVVAKKLKLKLPKRVAGVKIPKSVRKGPVGQFLNSGAGQVLVAQALVAAAGALAVSKTDPDSRIGDLIHHPVDATRRGGRRAARRDADQAARVSYALREAAQAFRDAMETGSPAEREWREPPSAQEGESAPGEVLTRSEPAAIKKQSPPRSEAVPR